MNDERSPNRVRELREARAMSQVALAAAAKLTRQSMGAIEAGRATPAVDVALRIARALDCQVEELFGSGPIEARVWAEPSAPAMAGRAALAQIAGRWVAYPLLREGMRTSADGLVAQCSKDRVEIEPLRPAVEARDNLVIMGCALALGLLTERLNARTGAGRFLWMPCSSTRALDALALGHTHVAGMHLIDARSGEANVVDVRRRATKHALSVITLGRWEAGLLLAPGNPKKIRGAAELGRRGVRVVTREAGSGALRLLQRELQRAGLPAELGRSAVICATGHLEVAQAISIGAGDAGIATRDAALAYGLDFVPLAEERYDLVVSRSELADPRMQRLLDTMTTAAFRRELGAVGYDVRTCGERVADVTTA
jgi:putative molybdopterin biosynthesis protein